MAETPIRHAYPSAKSAPPIWEGRPAQRKSPAGSGRGFPPIGTGGLRKPVPGMTTGSEERYSLERGGRHLERISPDRSRGCRMRSAGDSSEPELYDPTSAMRSAVARPLLLLPETAHHLSFGRKTSIQDEQHIFPIRLVGFVGWLLSDELNRVV